MYNEKSAFNLPRQLTVVVRAPFANHVSPSLTLVVIDVDVDSEDYFVSTPDQVRHRTIARLEERGSGIILLHDLHNRTVDMLPRLLDDLHARGYTVVDLQPARSTTHEPLATVVN